jgi:hypothetical protein
VKVASGQPCHRAFPTLERLRNGDLLLAYRQGADHFRTLTGEAWQLRSRDGGATWSTPEPVFAVAGHDISPDVGMAQLSDGVVLLPLLDVRDLERRPRWINSILLRSTDYGYHWTRCDPPDVDGLASDWWWNTYGKIIELDNGTVLWPIARQKKGEEFWRTGLLFSDDGGGTWTRYADVAQGLADEKYILPLSRGRLIAHIRDLNTPFLYQSYSADGGRNWSPHTQTNLRGQAPCLFRTRAGALLSAFRDIRTDASGVALAFSFDEGATWSYGRNLYDSPDPRNRDCSYPTMVDLATGGILCAYYTSFTNGNSDIEAVVLREVPERTGRT